MDGRAKETSLFPCMVAHASLDNEADTETTVETNNKDIGSTMMYRFWKNGRWLTCLRSCITRVLENNCFFSPLIQRICIERPTKTLEYIYLVGSLLDSALFSQVVQVTVQMQEKTFLSLL